MEFVAYILGRMDAMEFDHQVASQREQAFVLQHANIHDTDRHRQNVRNRDFKKLIVHPFKSQEPVKVKSTMNEAIETLKNG